MIRNISNKNLEMTQNVSGLTNFQMMLFHMLGVTVVNLTHDYHITTPL
jgi:hypothetical protein